MVEKIIKKIKSLPPLPESVVKVREICDDPEKSIKELVPIIKEDPMFTADILKAANSPLYGFSRQITSIDQAIALFGMGTIQGFAISYAIRNSVSIDLAPYGVDQSHLMKVSSMQNALTLAWGKPMVQAHQQEMMTISLLMELGKVIASIVLSEDGSSEAFRKALQSAETAEEIANVEKEFLSITSEWIAALMFKHWQFSEIMIEMMRHLQNPAEANESIRKQTEILHVIKEAVPFLHPFCETCLQSAYEKADRFGLESQNLQEAVEKIEK
ncbi:HDOD domain-containing protein [Hydrogenimonas cancrithermarum]|uniref:HDOD domain-containing protein n=1 Tax=Hydrogenimonas cancrithermarum TaxID=2993563 RepID=A0ABN6WUC2_9BACT|nr:HDOD domain-containing protein [Hydrogenimonas cancrithermarum]BDY12270.1 HDOD domain-containing protein [Hydrogenimonas cancrithermarum]